jgi:hypothetical protein
MFLLDPLAKLRRLALGGETERRRERQARGESRTAGNGRIFYLNRS